MSIPTSPPASSGAPSNTGSTRLSARQLKAAVAFLPLVLTLVFNLYYLYPEVAIKAPMLNDGVLHLTNVEQVIMTLAEGHDPTDFWLPNIALGYPLFHYYQHLAYLPVAALAILLDGRAAVADVYGWTIYLLLSLFPLSIYWSMRRFGFTRLPSVFAGVVAALIATHALYGFDFASYVWSGYGLYTQLWGMFLLPLALSQGYVALRTGRGYFWAVLLLAATLLSHLVYGYIALVSLVLLALLPLLDAVFRNGWWARLRQAGKRIIVLLGLTGLVISYFLVPFLQHGQFMNRSVWEEASKYNAYGYAWTLETLARGELFDYGRWPVLTILAGLGLALCLVRWREEHYRAPVVLGVVWLLLYFGRPTWGVLLDLLPLSRDLHLHRLIAGVHLSGIYLAGIGLAFPWQWVSSRLTRRYLLAPALLTALLLFPVYQERAAYLEQNARWKAQSQDGVALEEKNVNGLVDWLDHAPPGRVYAGLAATWGREYRIGAVPVYALLQSQGFDTLGYLYHALSLNADIQVLFDERRPEQYNLFNVRYVVAPVERVMPDFLKPMKDFGRHRLYQAPTTGYFDLVSSDLTLVGAKTDFYPAASNWLKSDLPRAKQHAVVRLNNGAVDYQQSFPLAQAAALFPQTPLPGVSSHGRVLSERIESNMYRAEVQVERAGELILKETYHPNWHAYIDGVETTTQMVMPSYVGVNVAPGRHTVQFEYQPSPLRGALLIVGLLTLCVVALVERRPAWLSRLASPRLQRHLPPLPDHVNSAGARTGLGFLRPRRDAETSTRRLKTSTSIDLRTRLGVYLLFFSIYLITSAGHFFSTDHIAVYLTMQSLVERGSLAIKPMNDARQGRDGQFYAPFGLGQSIASIPFYLTGKWVDNVSPPVVKRYFSGNNLGDWGGTVPIFFVSLFNQFVTPLVCLLVFLFGVRLGFSVRAAFLTTLILGFSTGAWVYAREYFQHPLESLLLLSSIYIPYLHQAALRRRHVLLAGAVLGFGIFTRINLVIVAPLILAYVLVLMRRQSQPASMRPGPQLKKAPHAPLLGPSIRRLLTLSRQELAYLLAFAAPVMLALIGVMALNYLKFGDPLLFNPPSQTKGFSTPVWVGLYGNLFSVGRSIFLYSPPTVLAIFAYRKFYQQHRAEAVLGLSVAASYLLFYSVYGFWEGGWAWGPRFLWAIVPLLVIPLPYLFDRGRHRVVVLLVALLGVGVQILGVTVNYTYVYWDWINMKLSPPDAYLFVPALSAIPTHLVYLLRGRYIDLWLVEVFKQFGVVGLGLTLFVPLTTLAIALTLLRDCIAPRRSLAGPQVGLIQEPE